jgi:hypothetical protein
MSVGCVKVRNVIPIKYKGRNFLCKVRNLSKKKVRNASRSKLKVKNVSPTELKARNLRRAELTVRNASSLPEGRGIRAVSGVHEMTSSGSCASFIANGDALTNISNERTFAQTGVIAIFKSYKNIKLVKLKLPPAVTMVKSGLHCEDKMYFNFYSIWISFLFLGQLWKLLL